jgi:2-isopropylmalate synthase
VRFLKAHALEAIFRDEDFFQCYCTDPTFALRTLEAAKSAGADVLCLRDSTGAGLPQLVREAAIEVRKRFEGRLGICAHDDNDLALANTLEAVEQGFTHVEGSMDAYGSRRGLANLCAIISSLEHKLGHTTIGLHQLEEMAELARLMGEASSSAFGRRVRVGVAQMTTSGETILDGIEPKLLNALSATGKRSLLDRIHLMELEGYEFRVANGTLELLVREELDPQSRPFIAERYDLTSHSGLTGGVSTATATVRSGGSIRSETEDGEGAVNALERSLRQCLFALYPEIADVHITDYHVSILDPAKGTASRGRVTITWATGSDRWVTAGVAGDLVEATWLALTDGFLLPLMRLGKPVAAAADSSWAV